MAHKKVYLRVPEHTDGDGTFGRVFHEGGTFRLNDKKMKLEDGSAVVKIPVQTPTILKPKRHDFEVLSLNLAPMPAAVVAWVWVVQPKFRPGDAIAGFVVVRDRLNPYMTAFRRSQQTGQVRLVNRDSGEVVKAKPVEFQPLACEFQLETSEYTPTGAHAVEVVDADGTVIGETTFEITRFEKKEMLVQAAVPAWVLAGDSATVQVEGRYFHGARVEAGNVTLEISGLDRPTITEPLEGGIASLEVDDLPVGEYTLELTLEDAEGRRDSLERRLVVADRPARLRAIRPEQPLYAGLPVHMQLRLETPVGVSLANQEVEVAWNRVGLLAESGQPSQSSQPDQTDQLDRAARGEPHVTDVNGYITLVETLEIPGTYELRARVRYKGEEIRLVEQLKLARLVQGQLLLHNTLNKPVFVEGEDISGRIRVTGHPATLAKVAYGYVDLVTDRVVETVRVPLDADHECSYQFTGVADFYGPVAVDFYLNSNTQDLGLVETELLTLDEAGCLVKRATGTIRPARPFEVDLHVEAPDSCPTGDAVKIAVNVDPVLGQEEMHVFGALVDERILEPAFSARITPTFLAPPSPLVVKVHESVENIPMPTAVRAPGGRGGGGILRRLRRFEARVKYRGDVECEGMPPELDYDDATAAAVIGGADDLTSLEETESPELVLRTNFAESVPLAPVACREGRVEFEVTVPDAVTTFRVFVFAASGTRFGEGASRLVVKNPVFTQIVNPAEMVLQDRVDVRCIVQNTTSEAIDDVQLALRGESGLKFAGDARVAALDPIPPNGAGVLTWPLVGTQVGHANVDVELATPHFIERSRLDQPLYVIPPGTPRVDRVQEFLVPEHPLALAWDLAGDEAFALGVINCLPALELAAIEGLEALAKYPYGCCEQTSASTLPNIVVYEYLTAAGKLTEEMEAKLVKNMEGGLKRYLDIFCGPDGGFGLWTGENTSVFHTGLALSVIGRMKPHVKAVPTDVFPQALQYLQAHKVDGHWTGEESLETPFPATLSEPAMTAYLLNSLAYGGITDDEAMGWLATRVDAFEEDPTTLALVLEAWALHGRYQERHPEFGPQLKDRLLALVKREGQTAAWAKGSALTSTIEATAYVVIALATAFPKDPDLLSLLQEGLNYLMDHRTTAGWQSTRDTLFASMAVAKVASADKPDFTLQVFVNGHLQVEERVTPETMAWKIYDLRNMYIDGLQEGANAVKLVLAGTGKCHVVAELQRWYFEPATPPEPLPLEVTRTASTTRCAPDDVVTLTIDAEPTARLEALLVEQPIPALCRLPEATLARLERELEHVEVNRKTDRTTVAIFFSRVEPGQKVHVELPLEAAFTGACRVEPLQVYGMYDPARRVETPPLQLTCTE